MLRVNVGLSRKVSKDYNSTGFSINLDGEITVPVTDAENFIEEIKQLYDLAEEALNQEIERYQSDAAIASRDAEPPANGQRQPISPPAQKDAPPPHSNGNGNGRSNHGGGPESATNKQVQYLLNLGKRHGLTRPQLEGRIEELLGKKAGVYELTKREAGDLIDTLSQTALTAGNGNGRGRH